MRAPTRNPITGTPSRRLQTAVVFVALLCAGYLTGLFVAWSAAVMPGLGTTDDQTFVAAIQGLETRFDGGEGVTPQSPGNWPTFVAFFTGPIWCVAALLLHRRRPDIARPIALALAFLIVGIVTSLVFNVPANLAITAAGDPTLPGFDAGQVRADFDEVRWVQWNHVRAVTSTLAFGCLAWAFRRQAAISTVSGVGPNGVPRRGSLAVQS